MSSLQVDLHPNARKITTSNVFHRRPKRICIRTPGKEYKQRISHQQERSIVSIRYIFLKNKTTHFVVVASGITSERQKKEYQQRIIVSIRYIFLKNKTTHFVVVASGITSERQKKEYQQRILSSQHYIRTSGKEYCFYQIYISEKQRYAFRRRCKSGITSGSKKKGYQQRISSSPQVDLHLNVRKGVLFISDIYF